MAESRFSESEAASMISAAAEPECGLTLAEVRLIAQELGINSDRIDPGLLDKVGSQNLRSTSKRFENLRLRLNYPVLLGWTVYMLALFGLASLYPTFRDTTQALFLATISPLPFILGMLCGRGTRVIVLSMFTPVIATAVIFWQIGVEKGLSPADWILIPALAVLSTFSGSLLTEYFLNRRRARVNS
jgi:hypothetical protein